MTPERSAAAAYDTPYEYEIEEQEVRGAFCGDNFYHSFDQLLAGVCTIGRHPYEEVVYSGREQIFATLCGMMNRGEIMMPPKTQEKLTPLEQAYVRRTNDEEAVAGLKHAGLYFKLNHLYEGANEDENNDDDEEGGGPPSFWDDWFAF